MAAVEGLLRDALMLLQYEYPLTPTPYCWAAERLGVEVGGLLGLLREARREGLLKRVGFYYNYRAEGAVAALIAFEAPDPRGLAELVLGDPRVTHNYLRDHPVYNVWMVARMPGRDELAAYAEKLAREAGARRWLVLASQRTYKLSVKYDLYRGVSRSGRYALLPERVPAPEELGVSRQLARGLRSLPLEERPYQGLAARHGMSEEGVVEKARLLLAHGVLGDPGAALDGRRAGFRENAMAVAEASPGLCRCFAGVEYTTHVVLRRRIAGSSDWPQETCYAMVHAVSRSLAEEALGVLEEMCAPRGFQAIYSLEDLKPGHVR